MLDLDLDSLRTAAGIGVAGNFAGHLEQAGEAGDFAGVTAAPDAPKGIFPWYVPGRDDFLGVFPLATDRVVRPAGEAVNLQIEPEVGVLCSVTYDDSGRVAGLGPTAIGAFNDCSIRRPGAAKISHKKNWGAASKGVAARLMPVGDIDPDGAVATLRLACLLRRDGRTEPYGVDSPVAGYSYGGRLLLDWIVERLDGQRGGDDSPLEDVGGYLRAARPATALIGIGATRYTPLGESTYLQPGDESIVIVYDGALTAPETVVAETAAGREDALPAASVLRQRVVAA